MKPLLTLLAVFLTACAAKDNSEVILTARPMKAKNPEDVIVLYNEYPNCTSRQQMASISSGAQGNETSAVVITREKAAKLGADYITIDKVTFDPYNQSSVFATAYKCGSVSRRKVPVSQEVVH